MVMVLPGVPVPLSVGVLSLVVLSPLVPLSLVGSSTPVGAAGAEATMFSSVSVASVLALPAASVTTAVTE